MFRFYGVVKMMRVFRYALLVFVLAGLTALASADKGVLRLASFPGITVADGRSSVTINVEIRDTSGRLAADGTQIVFSTTLGSFRDPVATTEKGYAQVVLVAGSIAGVAKVTANALAYNASSTIEVEMVADKSMLSAANDFIEVEAPKYLMYSLDQKTIGAAGPEHGASLKYREIELHADDMQINVPSYEVRARKAHLRMGKVNQEFDELYLKLNERSGFGTTTAKSFGMVPFQIRGIVMAAPAQKDVYAVFEIHSDGLVRYAGNDAAMRFEFVDLSESASAVNSRKALAFPRKEIQFHKADVYVGGAKVMTLPLFEVSLYGETPLLTEQVINVYDNQISINYPHYLSLKPGLTSLLRFRTGDRYGRGYSTSQGAFLDYELNWHRGDEMEGGLTFDGIARNDWGLGIRHFQRIDDRSSASVFFNFPAHQSMSGSGSISKQFDGFQTSLSGSNSRSLKGPTFNSNSYAFVLEKDPSKVGKLPFRLYYGLTATQNFTHTDFVDREQSAIGLRTRLQMVPWKMDSSSMLNASLSVSKLQGTGTVAGLSYLADLSMSKRLGKSASAVLSYNFVEDGFTSSLIGRHALSLQGYYNAGRSTLSIFGTKSIDFDRLTYYGDAGYRLSGLWRLSYAYTYNRYLGDSFLDDSWMVAYRLGGRDVGLVYSRQTKRLGLQLLAAPID